MRKSLCVTSPLQRSFYDIKLCLLTWNLYSSSFFISKSYNKKSICWFNSLFFINSLIFLQQFLFNDFKVTDNNKVISLLRPSISKTSTFARQYPGEINYRIILVWESIGKYNLEALIPMSWNCSAVVIFAFQKNQTAIIQIMITVSCKTCLLLL